MIEFKGIAALTIWSLTMVEKINVPDRTLFIGDNLDVLRGINSESIDLIYLDPPFNTGTTQAAQPRSEASGVECTDIWTAEHMKPEWLGELELSHPAVYSMITNAGLVHSESMAGYLTFMGVRLIEMERVLKPTGTIYLHCDPHASHYLKGHDGCPIWSKKFHERDRVEENGFSRRSQKVGRYSRHAAVLYGSTQEYLESCAAGAPSRILDKILQVRG